LIDDFARGAPVAICPLQTSFVRRVVAVPQIQQMSGNRVVSLIVMRRLAELSAGGALISR
jgi:hypothetical protein